ncbi:glycoside hydrolase family 92 protein [Erysipelothrix sp. D19-032]
MDSNNEPIHYNTITRSSAPGVLFTNNGFWDTYKSLFPLFSLIEPEHYELMLEGFLNSFHEAGYLPKWLSPMNADSCQALLSMQLSVMRSQKGSLTIRLSRCMRR